jgi:SAM-dependent methyltransferase
LPRDRYTVSDINPHYLDYLHNFAEGKPYMDVRRVDLSTAADFAPIQGRYDTIICLNVLEHIADEAQGLQNIRAALEPHGRAIILVPQDPAIYGSLDAVLGHERRYTRETLCSAIQAQGFEIERVFDFNRVTTPFWWLNGKVLKREHFSRVQLKVVNMLTWLFRWLDRVLPWDGASLIAIVRRPAD